MVGRGLTWQVRRLKKAHLLNGTSLGFGASGRWQGRFGHKETRSKPNPLPFQPMTPLHHFFIFPKSRFPLSFFKVLSPLASLKTFQCDFFFFFYILIFAKNDHVLHLNKLFDNWFNHSGYWL